MLMILCCSYVLFSARSKFFLFFKFPAILHTKVFINIKFRIRRCPIMHKDRNPCTFTADRHHLSACYSPEDLFFLEDQVSPGDQEGPKSQKQRDREKKKGML